MKRRSLAMIIIGLIICYILVGCGKAADTGLSDKLKTEKESEEKKIQEGSYSKKEPVEGSYDETVSEEVSEEDVASTFDAASFADAFKNGSVVNGSYFVRVGNKVYFRKISPDSMDAGAQFGEFLNTEFTPTVCPLICFDLNAGKYEEVGKIRGVGELYACPEGFYVGELNPNSLDSYCTDLYDLATDESDFYCKGIPLGVSDSGKLLAVEQFIGQSICTTLVRDGNETATLGGENIYYEYCGFVGETLIVLLRTASDEFILCSVDDSGDVTELGQVGGWQTGYPELEEFIMSNGKLYLTFGYYEGTGHFLYDYETVSAEPGAKGSLRKADVFDDEYSEYPENTVPKLCFEPDGTIFYSEHRPYEVYMGAGDNRGDLCYYDDIYEERVLVKDFIKNDYGEKCQIIQDITAFPETVFVIYADAEEDDEYSVGWRTGYKMTGWHICAIPFDYGRHEDKGQMESVIYFEEGSEESSYNDPNTDKEEGSKNEGDPLEGLVSNDILTKFRETNPVMDSATVDHEALRLGGWVQENIGRIPNSIREKGDEIGQRYEFWFGTDVSNNFDDNFRGIYRAYYSLKDYYTSDGTGSREFYESVSEENDFLGNGDPENIEKMYSDMRDFITDCNNIIRKK